MSGTRPHAPLSLAVGGTTVRFTWRHDRWAHEIAFSDGTHWESVEGPDGAAADPHWPASPVLVELSRLATRSGQAVLGVGLAGRSHFSASVGPDPIHPEEVRFDIACRVSVAPRRLGSTYRTPAGIVRVVPVAAPDGLPATVPWAYAITPLGIRPLAGAIVEAAASPGDRPGVGQRVLPE